MTNTASAARTHFAVLCNDTVEVVFPLSDLEALEFHKDFARRRHNTTRKDGSLRQIRITKITAQAAEILTAEFAALARLAALEPRGNEICGCGGWPGDPRPGRVCEAHRRSE